MDHVSSRNVIYFGGVSYSTNDGKDGSQPVCFQTALANTIYLNIEGQVLVTIRPMGVL